MTILVPSTVALLSCADFSSCIRYHSRNTTISRQGLSVQQRNRSLREYPSASLWIYPENTDRLICLTVILLYSQSLHARGRLTVKIRFNSHRKNLLLYARSKFFPIKANSFSEVYFFLLPREATIAPSPPTPSLSPPHTHAL